MKKIAITTTSFGKYDDNPLRMLTGKGYEIISNNFGRKLNKDEVVELCKGSVGVIAGTEKYDDSVISRLPELQIISRCGTGTDNIDLECAQRAGIAVVNTPDAPTLAVAELTVGVILDLLRRISYSDRLMRGNRWEKMMGNLLNKKCVGLIGFGRIGKKVAELLRAFDCAILFCDVRKCKDNGLCAPCNLDELLGRSDIISIHAACSKELISHREFQLMKKGSWLINMSRGGVVNEDALCGALRSGHLAGAALDVYKEEPYHGPLAEIDTIVLLPHIGSYAKEGRIEMEMQAARNLLKGLEERE